MIEFKRLKVKDLFSYGEAELVFRPGLFLLEGRNLDRGGSSNMSGKSALWDVLATVLWEENSRGQVKDDVVNRLRKQGEGVVLFRNGDAEVEVRYARGLEKKWEMKMNGKVEVYSWDLMKKKISEVVGMTYDEFVLSSWFQQNVADNLLMRSDKEKKELFVRWLGLGVFERMREKVKERRKEVEVEVETRKKVQEMVKRLRELEVREEDARRAFEVLEKWQSVIPVSLQDYRQQRKEVLEQLRKWRDAQRVEKILQDLQKIRDEISGKLASIKEKQRFLKDGRCWVCGSKVDVEKILQEARTQMQELEKNLQEVEAYLRKVEKVYMSGKWIDRSKLIREMVQVRKRVGDVKEYKWALGVKARLEEQERMRNVLMQVDERELEVLEWELDVAKKWEKGLSDDGIVAYVLEKVLVVFNSLIEKYAKVLGLDVRFRIGKKGQLEVEVSDGFKSMGNLDYWSGSEKYAVALAVMFGLSEFLTYQGKGTNLLVLDEVFAPFDEVWRMKLVELLEWLRGMGKTVVVVTHHEDVKRSVEWDGVWVVEKKDGISKLRV